MLLRVRSCVGTWRISVEGDDVLAIKSAVQSLHGVDVKLQSLSLDPAGELVITDDSSKLSSLSLSHGGMVYLQGNVMRDKNGGFTIEKEPTQDDNSQKLANEQSDIDQNVKSLSKLPNDSLVQGYVPIETLMESTSTKVDEVRQPDAFKQERLVEDDPFDTVDLAMDMAATALMGRQEAGLPPSSDNRLQNLVDSGGGQPRSYESTVDSLRRMMGPRDLDWAEGMAAEVMALRDNTQQPHGFGDGSEDESLARLLQLAEAEAEATMYPQLYSSGGDSASDSILRNKMEITSPPISDVHDYNSYEEDIALNEAIQRSMMSPLSSTSNDIISSVKSVLSYPPKTQASTSNVRGRSSSDSIRAKRPLNVVSPSSSLSSFRSNDDLLNTNTLDRAAMVRRRADQILEASNKDQTYDWSPSHIPLLSPAPSAFSATHGSSDNNGDVLPRLASDTSNINTSRIPQVRVATETSLASQTDLSGNSYTDDDVCVASAVQASINDILNNNDVSREMSDLEYALAQSVLES